MQFHVASDSAAHPCVALGPEPRSIAGQSVRGAVQSASRRDLPREPERADRTPHCGSGVLLCVLVMLAMSVQVGAADAPEMADQPFEPPAAVPVEGPSDVAGERPAAGDRRPLREALQEIEAAHGIAVADPWGATDATCSNSALPHSKAARQL